jgi:signal transduction histidine kinase
MNRIFDPFFTTKKVARAQGWDCPFPQHRQEPWRRLWAENNTIGGATFFIELPVDFSRSS